MQTSICRRLVVMSVGAVLALLVVGGLGYVTAQQIMADMKFTKDKVIRHLSLLGDAESSFLLIRVNGVYHLSYENPEKKAAHAVAIKKETEAFLKAIEAYEKIIVDGQDKAMLDENKQLFSLYQAALKRVLEKSDANDQAGAHALVESEWKPAGEKLTRALAKHKEYNDTLASNLVEKAMASGQRSILITVVFTLGGRHSGRGREPGVGARDCRLVAQNA